LALNDPIPEEEKSRRLAALQEKQREIQGRINGALAGRTFEVLVSNKSRREHQWSGHAASNKVINFTSQASELLGTYVQVRVTGATTNGLSGEHVA
jgi:tRNA-2-methylthio-N6-dimethylallyladenosine synthase